MSLHTEISPPPKPVDITGLMVANTLLGVGWLLEGFITIISGRHNGVLHALIGCALLASAGALCARKSLFFRLAALANIIAILETFFACLRFSDTFPLNFLAWLDVLLLMFSLLLPLCVVQSWKLSREQADIENWLTTTGLDHLEVPPGWDEAKDKPPPPLNP